MITLATYAANKKQVRQSNSGMVVSKSNDWGMEEDLYGVRC